MEVGSKNSADNSPSRLLLAIKRAAICFSRHCTEEKVKKKVGGDLYGREKLEKRSGDRLDAIFGSIYKKKVYAYNWADVTFAC